MSVRNETYAHYDEVAESYTGFKWWKCETFDVCFKFLTLIVFEIYGRQKSDFFSKISKMSVLIELMIATLGR